VSKLALAAMTGILAFGLWAGSGVAQAAPPPPRTMQCTSTSAVWDDTDIVHLTVPILEGNDSISWRARGHATLTCNDGSSTTTRPAQLEQRVQARITRGGAIQGHGQTRVSSGDLQHSFSGNFTGTTTVNAGTLSLAGDFDADGKVDGADYVVWRMHMGLHGTVNLTTKQAGFYIDDIIIGAKAQ
jgi:hypothetical protein